MKPKYHTTEWILAILVWLAQVALGLAAYLVSQN